MLSALIASVVLSVVPPVAADPCYEAYKDRMAEIDQWVEDCISVPIPGPTPCMDWPECCSADGEVMRDKAWRDYLICVGILPPENPENPGTGCFAVYAAECDVIIRNMVLCSGTGSVPPEACVEQALRLIDEAAARLRACLGLPPETPAAMVVFVATNFGSVQDMRNYIEAVELVALVEGVAPTEASNVVDGRIYTIAGCFAVWLDLRVLCENTFPEGYNRTQCYKDADKQYELCFKAIVDHGQYNFSNTFCEKWADVVFNMCCPIPEDCGGPVWNECNRLREQFLLECEGYIWPENPVGQ